MTTAPITLYVKGKFLIKKKSVDWFTRF
jgi:hypothetical protein